MPELELVEWEEPTGTPVSPPKNQDHVLDPMGGNIPRTEPVFVLRGSDKSAAKVLKYWQELNPNLPEGLRDAVESLRKRMVKWPGRRTAGYSPVEGEDE